MTRSLPLISLLVVFAFASCSRNTFPLRTGAAAILPVGSEARKYTLSVDFSGKRFDGLLIAKRMADGELRVVASTMFGLSLFDFGLRGEDWTVYSCLEPIRKDRVLKLFEKDFKFLFLPDRRIKKIKESGDGTRYVTGGGLSKGVVTVTPRADGAAEKIRIRHSWLRLTIGMEKMKEEHVTE